MTEKEIRDRKTILKMQARMLLLEERMEKIEVIKKQAEALQP